MGNIGVVLAMLGVVACPITSGDTAFRSARYTVADWIKMDQESFSNRLKLCVPLLGCGAFLGFGNSFGIFSYAVIWRYFSWTNQTLAMLVLWTGAMYLVREKRNYWVCAVPATFMSAVSATYFLMAPECLGLIPFFTNNTAVAYPLGIVIAAFFLYLFIRASKKYSTSQNAHLAHA